MKAINTSIYIHSNLIVVVWLTVWRLAKHTSERPPPPPPKKISHYKHFKGEVEVIKLEHKMNDYLRHPNILGVAGWRCEGTSFYTFVEIVFIINLLSLIEKVSFAIFDMLVNLYIL